MSNKYLSLHEAAAQLGIEPAELNRLRERGEIRGFADRGTWKFSKDSIDNLGRMRQPTSDPEVPLGGYTSQPPTPELVLEEEDERQLSEQPTIIRPAPGEGSDSDVRLLGSMHDTSEVDVRILADSDSDVRLSPQADPASAAAVSDSDSDVRLSPERKPSDSDSDVRLVGPASSMIAKNRKRESDSDVKLVKKESDSDVKLVDKGQTPPKGKDKDKDKDVGHDSPTDSDLRIGGSSPLDSTSDSDVRLVTKSAILRRGSSPGSSLKLAGSPQKGPGQSGLPLGGVDEEGISLAPLNEPKRPAASKGKSPSDTPLAPLSDSKSKKGKTGKDSDILASNDSVLDDDSGISLGFDESGIGLAGDSGISLDRVIDSGISLGDDSALTLADSGISLESPGDSGIRLDTGPATKGKAPKAGPKKKKPLEDQDDLGGTIPMMDTPLLSEDGDLIETQMEVPLLGDDSSGDVRAFDSDATNVIALGDDDDALDEHSATTVHRGKRPAVDDDLIEDETFETFEDESDVADVDDVDITDEVGEDDEIEDIDVFGAEDEDFEPELETGASRTDLPSPMGARGVAAPVEQDWGMGTFVGLGLSTVLMVLCGMVMFDLVRNMWYAGEMQQTPVSGAIIDAVKGLF